MSGFDSVTRLLLEFVTPLSSFSVNWLLQSTLLIVVGIVVGRVLKTRGSAAQSAVYRTTLVAVLLCPFATMILSAVGLSGWSITLPPAIVAKVIPEEVGADSSLEDVDSVAIQQPLAIENQVAGSSDDFSGSVEQREIFGSQIPVTGADPAHADAEFALSRSEIETDSLRHSEQISAVVPMAHTAENAQRQTRNFLSVTGAVSSVVLALWFLVTTFLVMRLALAWKTLWRLKRNSKPAETSLRSQCKALSDRMGVASPALLRTPFLPSPCLAGLRDPSILLPEEDCGLSMQDVLIHELAHLYRRDCYWNLLRHVATSVFFFQPLMWLLSRKIEISAEEVCDDYVVKFGGDRTEYANRLVGIAELSTAPVAPAGVGVVSLRSMLGHRVTRIMDTSRTLSTRASNMILAVVLSCGLVGTAATGLLGLKSDTASKSTENDSVLEEGIESESDENVVAAIQGVVLLPDGKPAANAVIDLHRWCMDEFIDAPEGRVMTSVEADESGEFTLEIPKSDRSSRSYTSIVAHSHGHGPAWVRVEDAPINEELQLKLTADELPIVGKLVDLEGRPVSNAKVTFSRLLSSPDGDLNQCLAALKRGQPIREATFEQKFHELRHAAGAIPRSLLTDSDGKFQIRGFGGDRFVRLIIESESTAYAEAVVATREMDVLQIADGYSMPGGARQSQVYGANCTISLAPDQPISGVVTDSKTGTPLSGVTIESYNLSDQPVSVDKQLRVMTDENGRYSLRGMPRARGRKIVAVPNEDQPYFIQVFDVPDEKSGKTIDLDMGLERGIWISGKVRDKRTREPIENSGGVVHFFPYMNNPHANGSAAFADGGIFFGYQLRCKIKDDGSYRAVGLPGKSIFGVSIAGIPQGQGSSEIAGANENGYFPTYSSGLPASSKYPTAMKEVEIDSQASSFEEDIFVDQGESINVVISDVDGEPVHGARISGHVLDPSRASWETISSDKVKATGMTAGVERTILVSHSKFGIGKVARLSTESILSNPTMFLELERFAKVTGRVVDGDGEPIVGAQIGFRPLPDGDFSPELESVSTDIDGSFTHPEVLTGADYFVSLQSTEESVHLARQLNCSPGETIDLGTINIAEDDRPKPVVTAIDRSPSNFDTMLEAPDPIVIYPLNGVVRDTNQQPVPNAKVKVMQQYSGNLPESKLIADTTTDQHGKFQVFVNEDELQGSRSIFDRLSVYAYADGFGSDWAWPQDASACKNIKLNLVEDNHPITGKLIDLEGNPLEGLSVRVTQVSATKTAILDQFLDSLRTGQSLSAAWNEHGDKSSPFFPPGFPRSIKTGRDGSFSIQGVGKERKVDLMIEGKGVAFTRTSILTRSMGPLVAQDGPSMPGWAKDFTVYGSECVIPVPPSQTITGIVKDARTGEPLAGVTVESHRMAERGISGGREIRVQTDTDGRYTLTGMPKGTGKQIMAVPNDEQPYLMRTFDVPNPMGMEPIELDLEMTRGVWISGTITDTSTRKPLKDKEGLVYYFPYFSNSFAQAAPEFDESGNFDGHQQRYKLAADGTYRLVGLPGKAIVGVLLPWEPYPQGQGFEQIKGPKKNGHLQTWRVGIDPFEKFPTVLREVDIKDGLDRFELNFEVNPGKSIRVQMSDSAGKPLSDVRVYGHEIRSWWNEIPESKFDAVGFKVGEKRTVLLHHLKQRLGKVVQLAAEDAESQRLQVQLEPLVSVKGQLVDKDGEPVVGATIRFSPQQSRGFSKELERIFTDAEGRFENAEVLPGADYTVMVESSRTGFATVAKRLELSAGETINLGTIDVSSDARPEPVRNMRAAEVERSDLTKAQNSELESTKIIGNVVDEHDRPVAGAHVAVIGYSTVEEKEVAFGSGVTDADGKCEITCRGEFESDENPRRLIARKDGVALGWKLVLQSDLAEGKALEIKLSEESAIKGRLVDIDGQPAARETLVVEAIFDRDASQRSEEAMIGFRLSRESSSETLPEAWLPPFKTDKDGCFELAGIPDGHGVYLRLSGSEKFAPQNISLNSGQPEQRGPRDGTYRPLVKNVEPGEEALLTLAPAKIITGKVTYEDSDEPVPNAKVSIWASQEEFGSMSSVFGKTDAEGNYRILPEPGIRFGVQAYPPAGVPYMGRQSERIKWENSDTTRNIDIQMPRVTLVKGRVVEKGTGKPVVGATITYESSGRTTPANAITGWQAQQKTNADGKFTYAVSAGRGTLVARKLDSHYVLQTMESRMMTVGQPGGTRFYANAFKTFDIEEGTDEIEAEIEVLPGKTVRGVIVDEAGNSIDKAFIITRLKSWDLAGQWRGDSRPTLGGKFELTGLKPDETYKVHFLDAWQKLGTTIELKATDEEVKVVLQPCGSAKAKFIVDDENDREKMREMGAPSLFFTLNPGVAKFDFGSTRVGKLAADEEFNANVDRINYGFQSPTAPKLDDDFCVTYPALIPGATYRLQTTFDQSWGYKEFVAESGETLDLGGFTPKFER